MYIDIHVHVGLIVHLYVYTFKPVMTVYIPYMCNHKCYMPYNSAGALLHIACNVESNNVLSWTLLGDHVLCIGSSHYFQNKDRINKLTSSKHVLHVRVHVIQYIYHRNISPFMTWLWQSHCVNNWTGNIRRFVSILLFSQWSFSYWNYTYMDCSVQIKILWWTCTCHTVQLYIVSGSQCRQAFMTFAFRSWTGIGEMSCMLVYRTLPAFTSFWASIELSDISEIAVTCVRGMDHTYVQWRCMEDAVPGSNHFLAFLA